MSRLSLPLCGFWRALALSASLGLIGCSDDQQSEVSTPVAEQPVELVVVPSAVPASPSAPAQLPSDPVVTPQPAPESEPSPEPEHPPLVVTAALPRLAIIIDDVGQSLPVGRRVVALPGPVALAILPFLHHSQVLATEAAAAGKPVMLHLPMENMAGLSIGPGGLTTAMPEAEFRTRLQQALNAFNPIQGVNNHMGSRLTADRQRMDWLMQVLAERQLFYVDSRTTAQTQAAVAAEAARVPSVSRDVFLDNQRSEAEIDHEFALVVAKARKDGAAVLIGHPYPETLRYLEWRLPQLEGEGVQLVSVQGLLER